MESVKELKVRIANAKRNVSRLERKLARAERLEKEAKEAKIVQRIKAFLEANAEKVVILCCFTDEYLPSLAKDVVVYQNENKCWCIKRVGEGKRWEIIMEALDTIFVEADI